MKRTRAKSRRHLITISSNAALVFVKCVTRTWTNSSPTEDLYFALKEMIRSGKKIARDTVSLTVEAKVLRATLVLKESDGIRQQANSAAHLAVATCNPLGGAVRTLLYCTRVWRNVSQSSSRPVVQPHPSAFHERAPVLWRRHLHVVYDVVWRAVCCVTPGLNVNFARVNNECAQLLDVCSRERRRRIHFREELD